MSLQGMGGRERSGVEWGAKGMLKQPFGLEQLFCAFSI